MTILRGYPALKHTKRLYTLVLVHIALSHTISINNKYPTSQTQTRPHGLNMSINMEH